MAKMIVTLNDISDMNHSLEDKGLSFKVHLHDACGAQSFTMEELRENNDGQKDAMQQVIKEYFEGKRAKIEFSQDGMGFVVIS